MKICLPKPPSWGSLRGFALIITITLMVLLTIIVVGLLSLSSVSLRNAGHGESAAVARNNARLGMMLALGELQATMGPDRRVSATASAVSSSATQPHLTGVWETPQGGPPMSNPANYYSEKAAGFKGWLASSATPADASQPGFPSTPITGTPVELVGELSLNGQSTRVDAQKIPLVSGRNRGSLAWAAFDESAKAAIDLGSDPDRPLSGGMEVATRTSPDRFRADVVSGLTALEQPRNLISLETAVIPGGQDTAGDVRSRFHDFTTNTVGLLTDNANGGLRTDLTSLFEAPTFPAGAFATRTPYFNFNSGAPQWPYLYDHYRKYRTVTGAAAGTPSYTPTAQDLQISRTGGLDPSPERERLIPVIAKLQIVFSVVSHHAHLGDRMNFYNQFGDPQGNQNHAVPHLAYDPVITLYNPYDVALDLRNTRIRIWDPPVGFRLAKIDKKKGGLLSWYRQEFASGQFHSLAMFQIANERNRSARRFFTLVLSDGNSERVSNSLKLQPGEVKVFSPRVDRAWTWGLEVSGGYSVRSFFDWNHGNDFGNRDPRTNNQFGVESIPGWDTRAGLQTDHMSYGGGRPPESQYDFERERNWAGGFVSLRITDDVRIEAKPQKTSTGSVDFQVDILAGRNPTVEQDVIRSFRFTFQDHVAEMSENPTSPTIERVFNVNDTLQKNDDRTSSKKKPFAMLEMAARTTRDPLDESKAWLFNNPVVEGGQAQSSQVGLANQSYDVRLIEMQSFNSFPGIELDPTTFRGFFGASKSATEGSSNVPMHRVPVAPAASLGDLIPANLVSGSVLPRVVHPLGNSRAHPLLPTASVSRALGGVQMLDHSYLLNNALWDSYYFSSLTSYDAGLAAVDGRNREQVIRGVLDGSRAALNSRLIPAGNPGDAETLAGELDAMPDIQRSKALGAHLAINGPFNLNSVSVDAWRSVLSSLRDRAVTVWTNGATENDSATPFPRMSFPLAGAAEVNDDAPFDVLGQIRWAGFRALDDEKIEQLAREIVEQIRLRGEQDGAPALTLGDFINRRPGSGIHSQAGIIQTAIDRSGINDEFHRMDSKEVVASNIQAIRRQGAVNLEAMNGWTGEGAPSILSQGDVMMGLAPIATVRGDTFKIRSYGESTSPDGTVLARAWCEAVVQRSPEFVDPVNAPEVVENELAEMNKTFGRRFNIVSFRWLNEDEI